MKKSYTLSLILAMLFVFSGFYLSNDPFISKLERQLEKFGIQFPQEKIYVHTDKENYIAGEDLWFKVYLRNASTMLYSEISTVAYVELIDENKRVVSRRSIFIQEGSGAGDIELSDDLLAGAYTLRAYTSFMKNYEEGFFFKKNINIFQKKKNTQKVIKPSIEKGVTAYFFPEGGHLVDGIASRVGFKVVDNISQNGISIDGRIVGEDGKVVAYMKSVKFGLGVFNLTPKVGEKYVAEFEYDLDSFSFQLPEVQANGYSIQVSNRKTDSLSVKISTNIDNGLSDLYIVGQMRGSLFYAGKLSSEQNEVKTKISKDSLPDGIAQLTIFNGSGEPLCERLVFVEKPENQFDLQIASEKEIYATRETVKLNVGINDAQANAVVGDLSLTVTNSDLAERQPYAENIKSWMLLNSDLKGKIEQPSFYFSNNKNSTKYVLDILMMTQGWRRFTWKQLAKEKFPKIEHLPEIGFNIEGFVTKLNGKQRRKSNVYLSVLNEAFQFEETETDAEGNFLFPNMRLFDTTTVVLQARKPTDKKSKDGKLSGSKLLDIHFKETPFVALDGIPIKYNNALSKEKIKKNITQFDKMEDVKKRYDGWSIELSDVEITAKRKPKKEDPIEIANKRSGIPKNRVILDSLGVLPNDVAQILTNVPGLRAQGVNSDEKIYITSRGRQEEPIFVVDGARVDYAFVQTLAPSMIHFVDVYDRAPIQYNVDGGGAAIIIYTRTDTGVASVKKADGIIHVTHPGYYKAREFFVPDHADKTKDPNRPDYRTTLFWQPNIRTTENNNNEISFFACDQTGTYDVIVEGMTNRGIPVFGKYQIKVE